MSEWIGCDSCSAQAWYMVQGVTSDNGNITGLGSLYFCRHHFLKNEEALDKWAIEIVELMKKEKEPAMVAGSTQFEAPGFDEI